MAELESRLNSTVAAPESQGRVAELEASIYSDIPELTPKAVPADTDKPIELDTDYALETGSNIVPSTVQHFGDMISGGLEMGKAVGVGLSRTMQKVSGLDEEAEAAGVPLETPALAQLLSGLAQKMSGLDESAEAGGVPNPSVDAVDAVGKAMLDRYGNWENVKRTFRDDPAGFASDAVAVVGLPLTGGGSALALLPKAMAKTQKVAAALKTAGRRANALDPGALPQHALKLAPTNLMYRKTTNVAGRDFEDVKATTEYALDEGIFPTEQGLAKTRDMLKDKGAMRDVVLAEMTDVTVPEMLQHVPSLKRSRSKLTGTSDPVGDTKIIKERTKKYMKDLRREYPDGKIPAADMNSMKVQLYKDAAEAYGKDLPSAVEDTLKTIARGAKDALKSRDPDITRLNKDMGFLGNMQETLNPTMLAAKDRTSMLAMDWTGRRLTGSNAAGLAIGAYQATVANVAVLIRQIRNNSATQTLVRKILVESGKSAEEADIAIQQLLAQE